jgi:23S rRNA (uridine2552-2'-O)-methyltransferase
MAYHPNDHYARKAKKEHFAARSVYKLEEIDKRFKLIRQGDKIIDLGCSPGSWSQYASQKIGNKGRILGLDLTQMKIDLPNAIFVKANILETDITALLNEYEMGSVVDAVISDMAPKTTGVKFTDQCRSLELCEMALMVARKHLKLGGFFVCKIFDGPDVQHFRADMKKSFRKIEMLKPESTRKESKEFFFIGLDFQAERKENEKS